MGIEYSTAQLVACIDRELRMRRSVYPRWVVKKSITQATADREIATLEGVRARLLWAEAAECAMLEHPAGIPALTLEQRLDQVRGVYRAPEQPALL